MEELLSFPGNGVTLWIVFILSIGIAIAIDMGLIDKLRKILGKQTEKLEMTADKDSDPFKRALLWTMIWIGLASMFAILILLNMGYDKMIEFVTGYTLEKSLSVDNMFVFVLIFSTLAIPYQYQHKVLTFGILSAIAMRIPLILVGVSILENFRWIVYFFGGLLVFTAVRMMLQKEEKKIEVEKSILLRKIMPITTELEGDKFFTKKNGIVFATPILVALAMIESADLVFAIDSIPAVLAITSDPFIVITSNLFAILGLRNLYLLLAGRIEKFYYLRPALVTLLLFIGFKMIAVDFVKLPTQISLLVIACILLSAVGLSYIKTRQKEKDRIEVVENLVIT